MDRAPLVVVRAVALGMALVAVSALQAPAAPTDRVVLEGVAFDLERAATEATRAAGLMFRHSIDERGGMLFVFPDDRPRIFWMRNCLVDMDLLFLDARGRIVALHEMHVEPLRRPQETETRYLARLQRYPSGSPARFAIELRAGTARALGLRVGDRVDLQRVAPALE